MIYRNVIFDLDGTLVDSAELTGLILDQMLAERGVTQLADRYLIRKMDAVGGAPMIAAVMGPNTNDAAADLEEFRHRHRVIAVPISLPFHGVVEALEQLRDSGVRLAICSNKPQFLCEKILGELGLSDLFTAIIFTAIIGSEPHRARKPDPAAAHLALASLAARPSETIFCGDSAIDMATAKAAGVDPCLVSWGYGAADAIRTAPDLLVLHKMQDLVDLVHGGRA
jgi:phosphoglycolate phosphatase